MSSLKNLNWEIKTGLVLILISSMIYFCVYMIFHDAKSVFFYIGIDLAFIPLEALILVLVIERVISNKEKAMMMEKLNMVIGAFFSELGTDLLKEISSFDPDIDNIRKNLKVDMEWEEKNFSESSHIIKNYDYSIQLTEDNENSILLLKSLKSLLLDKRQFMLGLLENPNLLEHESFTDMLWAAFHLTEELENRDNLNKLPSSDYQHLSIDLERVYSYLIYEWLHYMEHLMNNYPYLFSLALRTNPFDPDAKIEIN
ncbi:MAG: hypothetical protein CVV28_01190 [Methanobacteriales archaeon HGW-Methanobacteriales-1]|jgi:hypothetical protein|nr:MAG: hypothetical protein CVV28_01190 [Methanobacteriales archaeon HGW-Methanobacteriales-1]